MLFSTIFTAALVGVAAAMDVHVVNVGKNPETNATGNKYWPERIDAAPGSMIQFQFWAGNHTATQSNFADPCSPLKMLEDGSPIKGIKSGFQPVKAGASEIPTFTIMVNDTKPIWFYCAQGKHCQGGMSMVINEPKKNSTKAANTLAAYKKKAAAGGNSSSPVGGANNSTTGGSTTPGSNGNGNGDIPTNIPAAPQTTAPIAAATTLSVSTTGILALAMAMLFV